MRDLVLLLLRMHVLTGQQPIWLPATLTHASGYLGQGLCPAGCPLSIRQGHHCFPPLAFLSSSPTSSTSLNKTQSKSTTITVSSD